LHLKAGTLDLALGLGLLGRWGLVAVHERLRNSVFNVLFDGAERRAALAAGPGPVGGAARRRRGVAGVVMVTTRNRSEVWEGRLGVRRGSNGSHGEEGKALYKGPYSGLVGTLEWTTKKKILPKLRK